MGSELAVLLVLAVAPGADYPPASGAFAGRQAQSYQSVRRVSFEEEEQSDDATTGSPTRADQQTSSRRSGQGTSRRSLRLASAHGGESVTHGGESVTYSAPPASEVVIDGGVADCACDQCVPAPHHHHHSCWGLVGLPDPCLSPGDMTQHVPYLARPKNYYYFRPYQYFHIAEHQREVTLYGENPKEPYANRLFKRVYARTVDPYTQHEEVEPITPVRPLRRR